MNTSRRAFVAGVVAGATKLAVAGTTSSTATPVFRAGAAVADITSDPGIKVDGVMARSGPGKGAHDRMNARSLAMDDGTTKLVLAICDVRMIARRICDEAKKIVSQRTGIPTSNLLVAATHTHGTPTPVDLYDDEPYLKWEQKVIDGIADAMIRAVANLEPAKLGRTSMHKPDYTFNRRWKLREGTSMPPNPFGGTEDHVLTNPAARRDALLEPAGPVDDDLTIISLRRASDDRPLAVMGNYSTHYVGGYADQLVSSDYYGVFSERVKQLLAPTAQPPFVAMMFNGTSGDVNTIDFRAKPDASPPWERIAKVGEDMAQTAVSMIASIKHTVPGPLRVAVREIEVGVRKPDAQRIAWAEAVQKDPAKNKGWPAMYARETLAMVPYPDRFKLLIQAMRIGDFAIAAMPSEIFAATGLEIKKRSPIQPTINIGLANGYHGYVPTPEQHALGGYETWLARTSYLEVNASTKIRDAALAVLADVA